MFFCCKYSPSPSRDVFWEGFPENVQLKIIGLLELKDKVRLSMTSKSAQKLTKTVATPLFSLQLSPNRLLRKKTEEIFVKFDENQENPIVWTFSTSQALTSVWIENGNGILEKKQRKGEKRDFAMFANDYFYGFLNSGLKIELLDVRGRYTGKMPDAILEVANFSFNDKYSHETQIPKWLDRISGDQTHFLLMSDHWNQILTHPKFQNPKSTCQLTGYDGISHEFVEKIDCRQIQLNNVISEKSFNLMAHKWSSGGYPDDFEWCSVKCIGFFLNIENLLEGLVSHRLSDKLLFQFNFLGSIEPLEISAQHYLIVGLKGQFAVFTGIENFARLDVINEKLLAQVPGFLEYLKDRVEFDNDLLENRFFSINI